MTQLFFVFFSAALGLLIIAGNPQHISSRIFVLMCVFSSIWSFTNFMTDKFPAAIWFKASYAVGILILCCGFFWVHALTHKKSSARQKVLLFSSTALLLVLAFTPSFIDKNYFSVIDTGTQLNTALLIYFIFYFLIGFEILKRLYCSYRQTNSGPDRSRLSIILFGAILTLTTTTLSSFIFPFSSIYTSGTLDSLGYSMFLVCVRHKLFNFKIISIHLVVFALWSGIFVRLITLTQNQNALLEIGIFIVSLIVGIILIRNALQNIDQREQIELLAKQVKQASTESLDHDS